MATTETPAAGTPAPRSEPRHGLRMFLIWIILALAADLIIWFVWYPHIPPGRMSNSAMHQQFDITVLAISAAPVIIAVIIYFVYSLVVWRVRPGDDSDGAPIYGNIKVQAAWIVGTTVIVLWLFVFGTVELVVNAGSGGGEGPNPIWTPTSATVLPVQVIAQQWKFTYRYPTFGGFESQQLVIPNGTTIAFHVTSLDVIHDFWAYQLSIKADANPQLDNVAYTTTRQAGSVTVRCDELCGLWHGSMFNYGSVVSKTAFNIWAKATERATAANTRLLPPFAWTYVPDANGADGGYYPDNVDPYSNSEVYGATPAKS